MVVSGGYFFKYSADSPYSRILPEFFNRFLRDQSIDLYSVEKSKNFDSILKTVK